MANIESFRFWCQKILPLVYDDSLSYYEVLCKIHDYLNKVIAQVNQNTGDIESLQQAMAAVQAELAAIKAGDYLWLKDIITNAIKNVWFGVNPIGQFVAYVPSSWSDVKFRTTGLDIVVPTVPEYGRIVVVY